MSRLFFCYSITIHKQNKSEINTRNTKENQTKSLTEFGGKFTPTFLQPKKKKKKNIKKKVTFHPRAKGDISRPTMSTHTLFN